MDPSKKAKLNHFPCEKFWAKYDYDISTPIGQGVYGTVYAGKERATGKLIAVKLIKPKPHVNDLMDGVFPPEVYFHKKASKDNEGVIKFLDWFIEEDHHTYVIVMERIESYRCLHTYIQESPAGLSERESWGIFRKICTALSSCHSKQGILHGDIKSTNILIDPNPETMSIKLIDFGQSLKYSNEYVDYQGCYNPPEMLRHKQCIGEKAEIWGLGVVLFELLSRKGPFKPLRSILIFKASDYEAKMDLLENVSESCKELIGKMLDVDQSTRIDMKDLMTNEWFCHSPE